MGYGKNFKNYLRTKDGIKTIVKVERCLLSLYPTYKNGPLKIDINQVLNYVCEDSWHNLAALDWLEENRFIRINRNNKIYGFSTIDVFLRE